MPLQRKDGLNPFRYNCFGILKIGPRATRQQIVQQCRRLCQELRAGVEVRLGELVLDDHDINEAAKGLSDCASRAEEMLLAHPPALKDKSRLKSLLTRAEELAKLPSERPPLDLVHPLAVMWFLPAPDLDAAPMPPWQDLGLGEGGDAEDLAMDIVFDE